MSGDDSKATPDWGRFGLGTQQPEPGSVNTYMDDEIDSDSDENELFKEEQKSATKDKPWWQANFFLSERVLFGAWDGVFTTCMLNIFGIIIFLRTGWMVGNAGVGYSILIVFITLTVATIGAMSSIGICERCNMESGGVYFLLCHVLGGQTAAAVGILYCFGQAVSCSLYTVGFGESISVILHTDDNPWVARGFAIAALILLTGINLAGVKWVIRLQLILLFAIMVAAIDFVIGSFMPPDIADGVLGYSTQLLTNNTGPDYANGESFFTVFGVFFPTACGVLSGINMSGDLRNARKAIAQGTIAATALSGTFYVLFVLILGSVVERWALKSDYMISEKVSALGALWLIGLYVSSITSCMGGLYGAPRILQSIATSNSFSTPCSYLGMGRGANKVPVVSLSLVALTSLIFICVGDVNFLAPIVTMPFLITYIAVDYAYFVLALTADSRAADSRAADSRVADSRVADSRVADSRAADSRVADSRAADSRAAESRVADNNTNNNTQPPNPSDTNAASHTTYGSIEDEKEVTQDSKISDDNTAPADDDLDALFPERKLSRSMENGEPIQEVDKQESSATAINSPQDLECKSIHAMKASWYSRFCNRWLSLLGAVCTLVIMFATQWLYAIVSLTTLALLYMYLVYAIPGASPGIAKFSLGKYIAGLCVRKKERPIGHIIVNNQHSPLVSTTPAQLNEKNADFSQRKPYHQSQMRRGEELPLCCDEPDN